MTRNSKALNKKETTFSKKHCRQHRGQRMSEMQFNQCHEPRRHEAYGTHFYGMLVVCRKAMVPLGDALLGCKNMTSNYWPLFQRRDAGYGRPAMAKLNMFWDQSYYVHSCLTMLRSPSWKQIAKLQRGGRFLGSYFKTGNGTLTVTLVEVMWTWTYGREERHLFAYVICLWSKKETELRRDSMAPLENNEIGNTSKKYGKNEWDKMLISRYAFP